MPITLQKSLASNSLIVPQAAGVASALGLLIAPARVDRVATVAGTGRISTGRTWRRHLPSLETSARAVLEETGFPGNAAVIERLADIRYVGQASELVVLAAPRAPTRAHSEAALRRPSRRSYVAAFTRTPPSTPVEIINIRVTATLDVPGQRRHDAAATARRRQRPVKGERNAYFPEAATYIMTTRL